MIASDRSVPSPAAGVRFRRNPQRGGYVLETEQFLPRPRAEVFELFSDAFELEGLTPPWLRFHVKTPPPIRMAEGAEIDYRLRVRGVPLAWRSRITVWEPPHRFVDEQLRGPYRWWRHEHRLEQVEGGTLCCDHVEYQVYGGRLVEALFVRHDLRRIFEFRSLRLVERFAAGPRAGA